MEYVKRIITLYRNLIAPKAKNKDLARQEYILNILLTSAIILSFVFAVSSWITEQIAAYIEKVSVDLSPDIVFFVFIFFLFCYGLSRKGKIHLVAYILLSIYYIGATYTAYKWGASVPQGLLI